MNEQTLVKTIQSLSQEIAQSTIDKHLLRVELEQVKEENEKLKQHIDELQKEVK